MGPVASDPSASESVESGMGSVHGGARETGSLGANFCMLGRVARGLGQGKRFASGVRDGFKWRNKTGRVVFLEGYMVKK